MSVNGNLQAGVARFSIDPGSTIGRSRIANQGYLGNAANNVVHPSIATLPSGRGIMNFTLVGKNWYPSQTYVSWTTNGPGGAVSVPIAGAAPLDDFCGYLVFNCGGTDSAPAIRPRFGDYSAASVYRGQIWFDERGGRLAVHLRAIGPGRHLCRHAHVLQQLGDAHQCGDTLISRSTRHGRAPAEGVRPCWRLTRAGNRAGDRGARSGRAG